MLLPLRRKYCVETWSSTRVPFMITRFMDFVNYNILNRIWLCINWICFCPMVKEWDSTCFVGFTRQSQFQSLEMCSVWNSRQYVKFSHLVIVNVMYLLLNPLELHYTVCVYPFYATYLLFIPLFTQQMVILLWHYFLLIQDGLGSHLHNSVLSLYQRSLWHKDLRYIINLYFTWPDVGLGLWQFTCHK
jgi:hypothetical protein